MTDAFMIIYFITTGAGARLFANYDSSGAVSVETVRCDARVTIRCEPIAFNTPTLIRRELDIPGDTPPPLSRRTNGKLRLNGKP